MRPVQINKPEEVDSYYWKKKELVTYCREKKLPCSGSKEALETRIKVYLRTGKVLSVATKKKSSVRDSDKVITKKTLVNNYYNDSATRKFFVDHVGSSFRFNKYLRQYSDKKNIPPGLTYGDLIKGWEVFETKRKTGTVKIDHQFQYNQFMRDFFQNQPNATKSQAIAAWNEKISKKLDKK